MKSVEITYSYHPSALPAPPPPADAAAARRRLEDGNRRFATLLDQIKSGGAGTERQTMRLDPHHLGLLPGEVGAPEQRPFAAVIGCADARVPIELIFGEGPNDLFVIRVAGNGLGSEVLGSLGYAIDHLDASLKAIVILGHSGCGAISAAVDMFLRPELCLPLATKDDLRGIIDRCLVIIQASAHALQETLGPDIAARPGYRAALIETAVAMNAVLGAYTVQQGLRAEGETRFGVLYGVYVLETRQIWAPELDHAGWFHLAAPPSDLAGFHAISHAVARCDRIASLVSDPQGARSAPARLPE
jgi:carbonic anhydrase